MRLLRFLRMAHSYADFSTSVSPALERALEERKSLSTIVLNVFGEDSFTVGILDDPEKCLDLDYCERRKIVVRRRRNTGGAILGSEKSAFIVLYLDTRLPWVPMRTMADAFAMSLTNTAEAIREMFGVKAVYRPLNDVEVDGRKLIASSARLENDVLTMRMILNVCPVNRDVLGKALRTPVEKVMDKKVKDPAARVTCLEEEAGRGIRDQELEALTQGAMRRIFGEEVRLEPGELNDLERKYARTYHEEYTSPEWLYANSERGRFKEVPAGAVKGEGIHKAPAGLIRVTLLTLGDKVHDLIITGDFHPKPYGIVAEMESARRGEELSLARLTEKIKAIMARPEVEIPGTEVTDFAAAFSKALQRFGSP